MEQKGYKTFDLENELAFESKFQAVQMSDGSGIAIRLFVADKNTGRNHGEATVVLSSHRLEEFIIFLQGIVKKET